MVSEEQLARSKAIQRRTGRTFHIATRLLPKRARHATYVLYAFFRVADDVVDDPDPVAPARQRRILERVRAGALGDDDARRALAVAGHEDMAQVVEAFDDLRSRQAIPAAEIEVFVDAMLADVAATDYADHDALSTYLRGSSVAVAKMMLYVMDPPDMDRASPHARALAEAFQLTNFLRDVREDVREYDRVYVPEASLAEHGTSTAELRALQPTPGLERTVRDELRRTEDKYRKGVAGIELLPADCRPAVLLAAVLYAEHHRSIRARGFDVFSERPSLSLSRQLVLAARTWVAWRRFGDPETVFYRVSAIDREPRPMPEEPTGVHSRRGPGLSAARESLRGRVAGRVIPWVSD
jgi:phytoene synthase